MTNLVKSSNKTGEFIDQKRAFTNASMI